MKRISIRDKLLKNFSLFSLIPVILFCIVMLIYVAANIQSKRKETICSEVENLGAQLDKVLQQASQIGQTVAADRIVSRELSRTFSTDKERYESEILLNSELLGFSRYIDGDVKVYIVGENGGLYKNSPYSFAKGNYFTEPWYETITELNMPHWFELHSNSYLVNTLEEEFISLGIPIMDEGNKRVLGCVMVEIQVYDILRNTNFGDDQGNLYLFYPDTNIRIQNDEVELYDDDKITLIANTGIIENDAVMQAKHKVLEATKLLTYWQKDFKVQGFGATARFVTAYDQLIATDWILAYSMPKKNYYQVLIVVLVISVMVTLVLAFFAFYISYRVAGSITKPILALKENVEKVQEGNFEIAVPWEGTDEIGDLGKQFNQMVVEIRNLMERIQWEHERQRHYELLLLQAQINPHFLYNTLDSLMWLIRMGKQGDATDMLEALTRFFKTGLNKGRELITIEQEISNVESYLTIQLMRYKKKLTFSIHLDDELRNYIVPKLILQPLVENSIYHGIKGKEEGGHIYISCRKEGKNVVLCVADTGVGMEEERCLKIQDQLAEGMVEDLDTYGLTNVNERLLLYFQKACTMHIFSKKDEGTRITIRIGEACFRV